MATLAATPTASPTALHGNPTACNGNPHGTPMSTAPRDRVRVRIPSYAVEVRGKFRCMPWKVLPQVILQQCHGMPRKKTTMCIGFCEDRTLAFGSKIGHRDIVTIRLDYQYPYDYFSRRVRNSRDTAYTCTAAQQKNDAADKSVLPRQTKIDHTSTIRSLNERYVRM